MEGWAQDLRFALRALRRTPGFVLTALVTLALGIGANSALFSVVYAVLLRPLPFHEPERLLSVWSRHTSTDRYPFQLPEFCDYREQNRSFAALAGLANWSGTLTGDGAAERLPGLRVSGEFFALLGVQAALGRTLRPADDTPGQEKVVVLSHGVWQRRFGGEPGIVGRSLVLNGEPFSVVGVLPAGFLYPVRDVELAIPLAPDKDPWRRNRETTNFIRMVGRLREGVTQGQATADLEGIAERLKQEFPQSYARKKGVLVTPLAEELTRNVRPALFTLLGAVVLVLLIACANLANLMLVRAAERRRESAIQAALGASRWRLVRRLLVESMLLALAGGALGVALAYGALPVLVALSPTAMPRAKEIAIDAPVLWFSLALSALAGALFGLLPARRAGRVDPSQDLKAEAHAAGGSLDRSRLRGAIVAAQAALMLVLLVGAGLVFRSFRQLTAVDAGFDPRVLVARLSLPRKDYSQVERVSRFYQELEARVLALPGVQSVAASNQVPLNGALASADFKVADRPPASEDQLPTAQYRMVTPAYFRSMGISLLAGRAFAPEDRPGGALVAVVSRTLARQSFPDRDPIGLQLLVKDNPDGFRSMQIVGVAEDVRHAGLDSEPEAHLYVPYHQTHRELLGFLTLNQYLVVRAHGEPLALAESVRGAVAATDPNVAVADLRSTGQYLAGAGAARRFSLVLLAVFAALAMLLAAVGMYGVVAYSVAQRKRETAVRLALGARAGDIVGLVLGEGLRRTAAGIALGTLVALWAGRFVESLLFQVAANDPLTYVAAASLLVLVSLLACLLPAWRAARKDPLPALRAE